MLLQSLETQEIKYKKETITTFRILLTPFYPKASQNPTDDVVLSFLYDDVLPYQVLSIKDDTSNHCFLLEYSSIFLYHALDAAL